MHFTQLQSVTLLSAGLAAAILLFFLIKRPAFTNAMKLWLFAGLGGLPILAAGTGNVQGFETTEKRSFCGSCHVMGKHAEDSEDPHSTSLAARHARNPMFGEENCYTCHADYGMYGTVLTKMGGMRHVWLYYTEYKDIPLDEALPTIHLRKPFQNDTCMQCHSTRDPVWAKVKDHGSSLDEIRKGTISCASGGCHGYAHPFGADAHPVAAPGSAASDGGAP